MAITLQRIAQMTSNLHNIFANFDRVAGDVNVRRNTVIWTYMRKHMDGVLNYIIDGKEQREKIEGRIADLYVYLMLLWASIEEDKNG